MSYCCCFFLNSALFCAEPGTGIVGLSRPLGPRGQNIRNVVSRDFVILPPFPQDQIDPFTRRPKLPDSSPPYGTKGFRPPINSVFRPKCSYFYTDRLIFWVFLSHSFLPPPFTQFIFFWSPVVLVPWFPLKNLIFCFQLSLFAVSVGILGPCIPARNPYICFCLKVAIVVCLTFPYNIRKISSSSRSPYIFLSCNTHPFLLLFRFPLYVFFPLFVQVDSVEYALLVIFPRPCPCTATTRWSTPPFFSFFQLPAIFVFYLENPKHLFLSPPQTCPHVLF